MFLNKHYVFKNMLKHVYKCSKICALSLTFYQHSLTTLCFSLIDYFRKIANTTKMSN